MNVNVSSLPALEILDLAPGNSSKSSQEDFLDLAKAVTYRVDISRVDDRLHVIKSIKSSRRKLSMVKRMPLSRVIDDDGAS